MNILTLDFETYFDDEYTLKKLTTEHYVRDARFEAHMCGFRWCSGEFATDPPNQYWIGHEDLPAELESIDWANTAVLMHHAHFDGLILAHRYGIRPRFILDTLSMARLQLGNHLSVGLESLARHYGMASKSVPYDRIRGVHWADMDHSLRAELGAGCLHDCELTWDIFQKLAQGFPAEEYQVIDSTVRMFTEPQLIGDIETFAKVWTFENDKKNAMLQALANELGADVATLPKILGSNATFIQLLEAEGVEIEYKNGKNGPIPAFAKTDDFMQGLLEHDDERVRALAECRLGLKSTLDQTRAERLGFMATRGPMPVYLSYCAAHTTRWGGGDRVNFQNFKRGSALRKGVKASAGYKVVKADASQQECRILNYVAGQWDVIEKFRNKEDPYVGIASKFYKENVYKPQKGDPRFDEMEAKRGTGKQLELSCGFMSGAETIVRTAKRGTYGPPVILTLAQGEEARDLYRGDHPCVTDYWKQAGRMISAIAGTSQPIQWGPLVVNTGVIWLPNGCPLWYPEIHYHQDEETGKQGWRYKTRKGWTWVYSGKLTENVVQAMGRVCMSQALIKIKARTGIRPAHGEHDSISFVVPDALVAPFSSVVQEEMTRAPTWLPNIPLACEISVGETM